MTATTPRRLRDKRRTRQPYLTQIVKLRHDTAVLKASLGMGTADSLLRLRDDVTGSPR